MLWSTVDSGKHILNEYSTAVVQGNLHLEDYIQVDKFMFCDIGTFVGIYDGHGGHDASRFIYNHLFRHILKIAFKTQSGRITEDVLRRAFAETEAVFLQEVADAYANDPQIAAVGSCCLVGFVQYSGTLYVAQLGDSRAVIGYIDRSNNIIAEQLTREHNADKEEVRLELQTAHPDDPSIVEHKNGAWRVKGISKVSRSIGDAYMKSPNYEITSNPRFQFDRLIRYPVLTAEPSIYTRVLRRNDQFVIFASHGLWEHLSNEEAVDIVRRHPREGIAKRLIQRAQENVARARDITYEDLKRVEKGKRREYHDDISVVVLYLDQIRRRSRSN